MSVESVRALTIKATFAVACLGLFASVVQALRVDESRKGRPVSVAQKASNDEVEEEIVTLNNLVVTHIAGGPETGHLLSDILADNFTFTDTRGRVSNKRAFLARANAKQFSGKIYNSDIRTRVTGKTARVTGLIRKLDGSLVEQYRYDNRFFEGASGWQVVSTRLRTVNRRR